MRYIRAGDSTQVGYSSVRKRRGSSWLNSGEHADIDASAISDKRHDKRYQENVWETSTPRLLEWTRKCVPFCLIHDAPKSSKKRVLESTDAEWLIERFLLSFISIAVSVGYCSHYYCVCRSVGVTLATQSMKYHPFQLPDRRVFQRWCVCAINHMRINSPIHIINHRPKNWSINRRMLNGSCSKFRRIHATMRCGGQLCGNAFTSAFIPRYPFENTMKLQSLSCHRCEELPANPNCAAYITNAALSSFTTLPWIIHSLSLLCLLCLCELNDLQGLPGLCFPERHHPTTHRTENVQLSQDCCGSFH